MRSKILYSSVVVILLAASIVLAVFLQEYRDKADTAEQRLSGINNLLGSYGNKPLGLSCGILNPSLASSILEGTAVLLPDSGQRTFTFGDDNQYAAWSDACLYERTDTKSQYVQLYITTYQNDTFARSELQSRIPLVNEVEALANSEDELTLYDAGVVYSARGRNIIEVAAINGKPAEVKSHAVQVFNQIIDALAVYQRQVN